MTYSVWAVSITTSTLPHWHLCISATWGLKSLLPPLLVPHSPDHPGRDPATPFGDNSGPASCIPADHAGACSQCAYVEGIKPSANYRLAAHCVSTHLFAMALVLSGSRYLEAGCFFPRSWEIRSSRLGLLPKALIGTRAAGASLGAMMEDTLRSLMTTSEASDASALAYQRLLTNTRSCLFGRAEIKAF